MEVIDYGIICQTPKELTAVLVNLDERLDIDYRKSSVDWNHYTFGRIGRHKVVISPLPVDYTTDAILASVAVLMNRAFRVKQMIYIGTADSMGLPKLGDVVVATSLVRCETGHIEDIRPDVLAQFKEFKMNADVTAMVEGIPGKLKNEMAQKQYKRPEEGKIQLFFGPVGISSMEVPGAECRNEWKKYDLMAIGTLGFGLVETRVSCLIVQGICSPAKADEWKAYAASSAAVVALKFIAGN